MFPSFDAFIEETAFQKVLEVDNRLSQSTIPPELIIGADTMVVLNGKLFGKPKTTESAFQMLNELMGKKHTVYTSVVIKKGSQYCKFTEKCHVYFGKANAEQIQGYIDTGEPM